ncbi:glucosamine inositolphosphorylceramide transferase family protein [Flavobacterium cerinum]|uniref:Glucosamine inositolphosphorylceramide transferase 1 N-terminal domain-containing protein n=1 Tax=Flavobacterium cerinum TaxID=2502784 RepID=A0ABY5IW53_9FLAO|nr:hypothetical protein [Flavobacterium cerinum]UUC47049.1 hypothetical protein NOX80_07565 [Flavobacterium cerinum]
MIKKVALFGVLSIVLLLVINNRTPFLQPEGGPWSVGFGKSAVFPHKIPVEKNPRYTLEQLKKQEDSTIFLADPFFIKERDTFYLFVEHKKTKPNGDIALLTSVDGVNYNYKGTVLTEKFHLSYPQVFKYKNEFYMVPETKGAGHVLLYKAEHFPYGWKVCDTLVKNRILKDPSIFLSDTLNILVGSDDHLNMYLFEADSLFGKWMPHKKEKVLMGTEARAGGRFFADKKGLLLPVQNSTEGYGFGLSLYRFKFDKGNYTVNREYPFFLKKSETIKEFNAGMHQIDIQLIGGKYYYVYDGNRLQSSEQNLNIRGPLKWNYVDFKNWLYQQCESFN